PICSSAQRPGPIAAPIHDLPATPRYIYLDACQPAIAGHGGHDQLFRICCEVGPGFDIIESYISAYLEPIQSARHAARVRGGDPAQDPGGLREGATTRMEALTKTPAPRSARLQFTNLRVPGPIREWAVVLARLARDGRAVLDTSEHPWVAAVQV